MSRCPFGNGRIAALNLRIQSILRREIGENHTHRPRIVSSGIQVLNTKPVGLELLIA